LQKVTLRSHVAPLWVQALTKTIALVIALVVGRAAPVLPPVEALGPVVCTAPQTAEADTLRAGERLEPRVAPAPFYERTPRVPPAIVEVEPSQAPHRAFAALRLPIRAAYLQRSVVLQNVPRLESGDPPRV
jgi:hypothetical protein